MNLFSCYFCAFESHCENWRRSNRCDFCWILFRVHPPTCSQPNHKQANVEHKKKSTQLHQVNYYFNPISNRILFLVHSRPFETSFCLCQIEAHRRNAIENEKKKHRFQSDAIMKSNFKCKFHSFPISKSSIYSVVCRNVSEFCFFFVFCLCVFRVFRSVHKWCASNTFDSNEFINKTCALHEPLAHFETLVIDCTVDGVDFHVSTMFSVSSSERIKIHLILSIAFPLNECLFWNWQSHSIVVAVLAHLKRFNCNEIVSFLHCDDVRNVNSRWKRTYFALIVNKHFVYLNLISCLIQLFHFLCAISIKIESETNRFTSKNSKNVFHFCFLFYFIRK